MRTTNLALVNSSDQSTLGCPPQQVLELSAAHDIESGISKPPSSRQSSGTKFYHPTSLLTTTGQYLNRLWSSLRLVTRPPQFTFSLGGILSLSGQISSLVIIVLTIIYACKIRDTLSTVSNPSSAHWTLHIFLVGASCLISFEGLSFLSSALSLWLPTRLVFVMFGFSTILSMISGALLFGWVIYCATADISIITPMTVLPSHISSVCSGPAILTTVFVFWLVCGLLNTSYLHLVLFPLLRSYTTLSPIPLLSSQQHNSKEYSTDQRVIRQHHIRGEGEGANTHQPTSTMSSIETGGVGLHISPSQWRRSPLAAISHNKQNSFGSPPRAAATVSTQASRFIPKLDAKASIASLKDRSRSLATFIAHPTSSIETLRSMNAAQTQLDQKMHPVGTTTSPSKFNKLLIPRHLKSNNNKENDPEQQQQHTPVSRMMVADNFCLDEMEQPQTTSALDRVRDQNKSASRRRLGSSLRFSRDLFTGHHTSPPTVQSNNSGSESSNNNSPFENWDASSFGVRERVLWTMAQMSSSSPSSADTQRQPDGMTPDSAQGSNSSSPYEQEEMYDNNNDTTRRQRRNSVASLAIAQPPVSYNSPSRQYPASQIDRPPRISTDIYQESPLQDKLARNHSLKSGGGGSEHETMSSLSSAFSLSSSNMSHQRSKSPVKATLTPRRRQETSRFSFSHEASTATTSQHGRREGSSPPKQWSPGSMISLHLTPDNSDKDDSPNTLASSDSANIILRDLCDMVTATESIKQCSPVRQAESPSIQASSIWTSSAKENQAGSSSFAFYNSTTPDRRAGGNSLGQSSPTKDVSTLRTRRGGNASYSFSTANNINSTPSAGSAPVGGSPIKSGRSDSVDIVKTLFFSSQYDRERWHNSRSIRKTSRIVTGADDSSMGDINKDL